MSELLTLQEVVSMAATPVGIIMVYCLGRLNTKISLLELEVKHLKDLINAKILGKIEE